MASSSNLAAVLPKPKARLVVSERAIPSPGPNDILVQNKAFGANPVDWKIQTYGLFVPESTYPIVLGSDAAGIVHSVGSAVSKFQPGDRVTGFAASIYNFKADHGAAQQWLLLPTDAAAKIPDSLSFTDASVFPMAWATAGYGLFISAGIPRPSASQPKPGHGKGLLVWGASSSVGITVVQIAKDLGFTVFATASTKHHEYIKSLGADVIFDYKDADVVDSIVSAAKDKKISITYGYDAVSENETFEKSASTLSHARNGQPAILVVTLPWPEKQTVPEGVKIENTAAYKTWTDDSSFGAWLFNQYLAESLEKGTVKSAPHVQIVPGGVEAIQETWDLLKKGVSGTKLVTEI